jgi:hypothetical protein
MKKFISSAAVLMLFFSMTDGSRAAMLATQLTDIWVTQSSLDPSHLNGGCGYLPFPNQHDTVDYRCDPGQNCIEGSSLMPVLSYDILIDRPELAFINLAGIIGDGIAKVDFSDITVDGSLIGLFSLNEYGILDATLWPLFGDFRLAGSMQVDDGMKTEPAEPMQAPLLMLATVLIGLIGFRRTAAA